MTKRIQEQFGESVIQVFTDFARADLKDPADLAKDEFSHVADVDLRNALSQVFYGVRWIYKVGLALLVHDEERAAHVRAQIVDYSSVVEALLSYFIGYAIRRGHAVGETHKWKDPDYKTKPISWAPPHIDRLLRKQPLWWFIRVAQDFGIITPSLATELDWLRAERNAVHIRERVALGATAYLNHSRKAFMLATQVISATKAWKATHP